MEFKRQRIIPLIQRVALMLPVVIDRERESPDPDTALPTNNPCLLNRPVPAGKSMRQARDSSANSRFTGVPAARKAALRATIPLLLPDFA